VRERVCGGDDWRAGGDEGNKARPQVLTAAAIGLTVTVLGGLLGGGIYPACLKRACAAGD
jgi:hypothetical protein